MTEQGGSLQPVTVSTDAPQAGPALRVVGYTSQPAGRPVLGGAALPVYVVSAAQVAAGYPVAGNVPVPMVLASAVGQTVTLGQRPTPVYVVSGSLDPTPPDPFAAFRSLLLANANRAYWGPDATLSGWPCAVTGLNAAPGGSGTTLGALGGVPAPVLSGAGWYRTAAFGSAIAQTYAIVAISQRTGNTSVDRYIHDGIPSPTGRAALWHRQSGSGALSIFLGFPTRESTPQYISTSPLVTTLTANGTTPLLEANGANVPLAAGSSGTNSLNGLTIGGSADASPAGLFAGPIALIAIFHGTNYASRAATVASAARTLIGV